ncbi:elongation factor TS-domain-containing protein [Gigaspora margarita]|uniref:Elongation factor Ts, mitochondrial n=1 Tax=Gigaspora margarita TaxID=4874 RepID=A0A8H4AB01_GIGMA|nr:elongation factor TS-domain-containing protein [Gigaspora margarita]
MFRQRLITFRLSCSQSYRHFTVSQLLSQRSYVTDYSSIKPDIKLLARLRQETQISITKAKEALVKHNNDYDKATAWLLEDSKITGVAKAEKLKDRTAKEGLIAIVTSKFGEKFGKLNEGGFILGNRGAIVEVNCETDFVSRNALFQQFATRIASTSLLFPTQSTPEFSNLTAKIVPIPLEHLVPSPLLPHPSTSSLTINHSQPVSVKDSLTELIGKLGENISIRRIETVNFGIEKLSSRIANDEGLVVITGGYVHGGNDAHTGKIGALVVLEVRGVNQKNRILQRGQLNYSQSVIDVLSKFTRDLARQVVGFNPKYISYDHVRLLEPDRLKVTGEIDDSFKEFILTEQDFIAAKNQLTVGQQIKKLTNDFYIEIKILEFKRWVCGEDIKDVKNIRGDSNIEMSSQAELYNK